MFFAAALVLVCATVFSAQTKKKVSSGERLMTALVNSDTLPIIFRNDEGVFGGGRLGISPDVVRILKLGKRAIPLLIRHLDDKRIFKNMVYCCFDDGIGDGSKEVSADEGVFFILVNIIRQTSPIYDVQCLKKDRQFVYDNDDCIKKKYYWGKNMKRNWLKALRAGKIRYEKYEY